MVYVRCAAFFDTVSGISDVDLHETIGGHPACIATTGATRDEGQEEQCCEFPGGSVGARQSITERQPGNSVEGTERLRPSTERYSEKRQRCDVLRTMRDERELVAAHSPDQGGSGPRDEAEQSHSACVCREATGKNRRTFCPHGHGSMMMQATPQQSLCWECSTCSTTSGLSLDGCDVRFVDRVNFEGADANMVPMWTTKHPASERAGATEGCGPGGVIFQLIYEIGQRLENQITTLGLVSRQKVESGEQVTELFNVSEGVFNCMVLDSQPTKSVPRRVRLAIERNIDEMCPKRIPKLKMRYENLDVKNVGTTRPLRGVALFD